MKSLAAEGRTVFVSSHLINEMAVTADRLVVIGAGRLLADTTVAELPVRSARLRSTWWNRAARPVCRIPHGLRLVEESLHRYPTEIAPAVRSTAGTFDNSVMTRAKLSATLVTNDCIDGS